MKFNEIIRLAMKETETTQVELGKKLGIRQTAVSIMLHRPEPSLATFHKILDTLGYDIIIQPRDNTAKTMKLTTEE